MENIFSKLSEIYEPSLVANLRSINEHLSQMKIAELWALIRSKKTNLKKKNKPSEQNGAEMEEEAPTLKEPEPIKYVSNILEVLSRVKFKISGIEAKKLDQLYSGVYEGGFLLWECERDGVEFLHYSGWLDNFDHIPKKDMNVLELGCGSGLVGVYLLQ